jgi:hypothetical protein
MEIRMHSFFLVKSQHSGEVEFVWTRTDEFAPAEGKALPRGIAEDHSLLPKTSDDRSGDSHWIVSSIVDVDWQIMLLQGMLQIDASAKDRIGPGEGLLGVVSDLVSETSRLSRTK